MIEQAISHYRILKKLGAGGMGEVYLAEDTTLNRRVALKLLPREHTQNEERLRRFKQEAKAASALNHPNILTIHEVGEANGHHFIATEFIDGETLRATLRRSGRMKTSEALNVAAQVASAVAAAHEAGIVHRDIKPENVMLRRDGYVKVLDFGLAKLTETAAPQSVDTSAPTKPFAAHTEEGMVIGTAQYMSPEQARGLTVDARTDIWSLGCVLYEMLAKRAPFAGETVTDMLVAILEKEPPPLKNLATEPIPDELNWIINKTLRKDKEERYQTSKELLIDLRRLKERLEFEAQLERSAPPEVSGKMAQTDECLTGEHKARWHSLTSTRRAVVFAAVMMAIVAAVLAYMWPWKQTSVTPQPEIKSLAVLPLENLSGDPAQEYFADGMTEALISNLAQIRALNRVISRTSVMRYKGSRKSLQEIAQELRVDAVIEGTVQRSGGRVRVTARLIPAATDSPVWTRDYERDLSDVLKLQSEVARAVADEIRIQITPEERARLAAARDINPQAHEAYLFGRHHLRTNEEDLRQAIGHFEGAIQLVPDYAAAYAGLSRAWTMRGIWGAKNLKEVMSPARDAALKAVALDKELPEAHMALSDVKFYLSDDWDWAGVEREITRALELDPNSADAHRSYADLLMALERHDEAIREIQRAEQLDPLSSNIQSRYGRVLYRARKYEEAVPHLQRAIDLDPNPGNSMPYWILGELYTQVGRYDEAIASFKKAQSHSGRALDLSAEIACVYARMGKKKEARRLLAKLKATTDPSGFSIAPVAFAYAALGD